MSRVAIYHPSINLPKNEWLQLSLLYWERVLRVVPAEYSKPIPDYVAELEAADLVRSWDPSLARQQASGLFLPLLRSQREQLSDMYRLSTGWAWTGTGEERWEADPGLTYIHGGKLTAELRDQLLDEQLAVWDPDGWIGVHPRIARTYMAVLVELIGRESAADPITDDPIAHVLGGNWSCGGIAAALAGPLPPLQEPIENSQVEASLALISVRAAVPARPLRVEEIIEIRTKLGGELWRFRDLVVEVSTEAGLEAASRPEALQMHLEDLYRGRISPELELLRRELKLLKVETILSAVNIRTTLPPAVALAAAQVGLHDPALSTGAAITASIFGARREIQSQRQAAIEGNPAAFLWGLEDRFRDTRRIHDTVHAAAKAWRRRS